MFFSYTYYTRCGGKMQEEKAKERPFFCKEIRRRTDEIPYGMKSASGR